MKIGIVGAGISGITLAVMLKKHNPEIDVTLIDINDSLAKKYAKTGNGRCNLGNRNVNRYSYNNDETRNIVSLFPIEDQIAFYNSIGIEVYEKSGLYYPYSMSANALAEYLVNYLLERKIKKVLECNVNEYSILKNEGILLRGSRRDTIYDKVIFATGGNSSIPPSTLKRADIYGLFKKHGYDVIEDVKPGLVPIITNEPTKKVEDIRVKCKVTVLNPNSRTEKIKYEEEGEVIFKKDGISGICVMNASSIIQREALKGVDTSNYTISLDLMPHISEEELVLKLERYNTMSLRNCLYGIFQKKIADYIVDRAQTYNIYKFTKTEIKKIAKVIKNLQFTIKKFYGFENSQVSIGGVEYSNLNINNLESKREPNIYVIGELLNADGLCGGYNIMFAVASAYKVYLDIIKSL